MLTQNLNCGQQGASVCHAPGSCGHLDYHKSMAAKSPIVSYSLQGAGQWKQCWPWTSAAGFDLVAKSVNKLLICEALSSQVHNGK